MLAWLIMVLPGILALGFLFAFIDLFAVDILVGNLSMYEDMAVALSLFGGTGYIALRAFRSVRRGPATRGTATTSIP